MDEVGETPREVAEAKVKLPSTEKVLSKLKPRQVEAAGGSVHTIYTFENKEEKPVEVLFFSPNELPLVKDEVEGKLVVINGDDPRWRSNEEWEDFSLGILRASENDESAQQNYEQQVKEAVDSGRGILLVETGPEAILETTEQLGIELDESTQEALSELRSRKLTEAGLEVVDNLLAGNLIGDNEEFRQEHSHEGEALYLLSLKGDKEAQQLLDKKKEAIKEVDRKREEESKARFEEQRQEDEKEGQKSLEVKDLVAVHATRYLPQKGAEGMEIPTTFEGSDWQIPRDTIHFALNHEVAPHMYGSWEGAGYVIISPLEDVMEANGKPTVLNTIDTFWEVGPGKRLKLPENTAIVQSGDLPKGEIISGLETGDVRYKASDLEPEDITTLAKEMSDRARASLNSDLVERVVGSFSECPMGDEIELPEEKVKSIVEVTGYFDNHLNILGELQEHPIEEVLQNILAMAEIEITDEQQEMVAQKIRGNLTAKVKRIAVEKKIMQMDYDVKPGGMWAWGGSFEVTRQTHALGAKLEVPVMAHTNHISSESEGEAIFGLGALLDTERTPDLKERVKTFQESKRRVRERFIPEVTQDSRRMFYLAGAV